MDSIFKKLYSVEKEKGFSEYEIIEAEKGLGMELSEKLRQFYIKYGRNNIINSCHYFEKPESLTWYESDWLGFYSENQGVCFWAIKKEDFKKIDLNVYVNYEGIGFVKEANSFDDFLIIRSLDYAQVIFPFRFWSRKITALEETKIYEIFGEPKSDVHIENYFHRKIFWNTVDEIVCIINSFPNGLSISVNSKLNNSFLKYEQLFPNVEWTIEVDRTSEKDKCVSLLEENDDLEFNHT